VHHLHAHFGTNSAEVAMLVNVLGEQTWSFTVHGPEEFDKAPLIGLSEKIRSCAFVVAVSSYGRSQLYRLVEQEYWPKIHVVHCGVDRSFTAAPRPSVPGARRLVCIGRLSAQKGQLLLLDATRHLVSNGMEFELVLAGDGELRKEIGNLINQYKLQNHVRVTGWISGERVRDEILESRALVLPSFAEGLPVVLMEAMALGRPVISTYVAGIPELVSPGENGWLVPAGDIDSLIEAMSNCLKASTESLEAMGASARARVLKEFNLDLEAKKLAILFSEARL
jgi:glycosyltransferase involved in cell wall biosynthesis